MTTYVLVHGSWHGGWCWKKVVPLLRAAGHEVHTPTLTGLGERRHLAGPSVGLETHIQDVVNLLTYENLSEVVLVGHSYGGMVISGVAEQAAGRLAHLVYLDAVLLQDGLSFLEDAAQAFAPIWREQARTVGDGWQVPAPPTVPGLFGVTDEADLQWMAARLGPQPLLTYEQCLRLADADAAALPRTYIFCTDWPGSPLAQFAQQVRTEPGWRYQELATGHDAMITMPYELADLLLGVL